MARRQFCDHAQFIRGVKRGTLTRYRMVLKLYAKRANISSVADITNDNVRAFFFEGRTKHAWKATTFICYYMTLKVFFRWCRQQQYISIDPLDGIETPAVDRKIPPKFTKQEAFKLLEVTLNYPYPNNYLRYRNHAMFSMFVFAGLRKSELLNLRFTDVDFENLTIFVNQGKGGKDRIIPMSYTLADSLRRYVTERKKRQKTAPEFFVSLYRNCGVTENGLRKLVMQLQEASGLTFTIHKLRHTFATLMLEGGCDIYSLSRMMGHSDIKTTTIYLSASAEHLRGEITKHPLNEDIKGKPRK